MPVLARKLPSRAFMDRASDGQPQGPADPMQLWHVHQRGFLELGPLGDECRGTLRCSSKWREAKMACQQQRPSAGAGNCSTGTKSHPGGAGRLPGLCSFFWTSWRNVACTALWAMASASSSTVTRPCPHGSTWQSCKESGRGEGGRAEGQDRGRGASFFSWFRL